MARHASVPAAQPDFTPDLTGSALEQAKERAERGIDPSIHLQAGMRKRDNRMELTPEDIADTVNVVCTTDRRPWTHERPLARGEMAPVPRKVALLMERNGHVTIIPDAKEK